VNRLLDVDPHLRAASGAPFIDQLNAACAELIVRQNRNAELIRGSGNQELLMTKTPTAPSRRTRNRSDPGDSIGIACTMTTFVVPLSFAGFGSDEVDVTVAVFVVEVNVVPAVAVIVIVAFAPLRIDPRLHVTVVVPVHEP
jgi:hypothetical protein